MLSKYLWQALRRFSADIGDNWDMNQHTKSSLFFFFFLSLSIFTRKWEPEPLSGYYRFFPRIH